MRVAAVVVNYNAGAYLLDCVRSLHGAGLDTVVVADNASTDSSLADLKRAEPWVTIVETGANYGYGGGVNRGAAALAPDAADVLLVCNADIVVEPSAVKALVAALEADVQLGIVGPRIDNTDGTLYPSARIVPRPLDAAGHAFLGLVMPNNRFTRRYRLLDWDHASPRRVDWVSGACFAIRRDLFDRLGGFNEDYYMYLEDIDLCHRAGVLGAGVGYDPAARVIHEGGVSTRQLPYRMLAEHHRSVLRFWWSSHTWPTRAVFPFVALGMGVRLVLSVLARSLRRS
ncbi:MAG TPA: glycosyltransferase family 2 protein [Acidimicrobiales bacterium]|nr:glycosyltransferase family 2 protein [Acidimicrobiales bacterium]